MTAQLVFAADFCSPLRFVRLRFCSQIHSEKYQIPFENCGIFVAKKTLLWYNLSGLIRIRAIFVRCARFAAELRAEFDGAKRLKTTKKGEKEKWQLYL